MTLQSAAMAYAKSVAREKEAVLGLKVAQDALVEAQNELADAQQARYTAQKELSKVAQDFLPEWLAQE